MEINSQISVIINNINSGNGNIDGINSSIGVNTANRSINSVSINSSGLHNECGLGCGQNNCEDSIRGHSKHEVLDYLRYLSENQFLSPFDKSRIMLLIDLVKEFFNNDLLLDQQPSVQKQHASGEEADGNEQQDQGDNGIESVDSHSITQVDIGISQEESDGNQQKVDDNKQSSGNEQVISNNEQEIGINKQEVAFNEQKVGGDNEIVDTYYGKQVDEQEVTDKTTYPIPKKSTEVIQVVAKGHFSTIIKSAIKISSQKNYRGKNPLELSQHETNIHKELSSFQHKNILPFLEIPKGAFAVPYFDGGSLSSFIQENKNHLKTFFTCYPLVRYIIIKNIAQGLRFMHDNNFIHRDLTSDNILFSMPINCSDLNHSNYQEICNKLRVVLADFGLSIKCGTVDDNEEWSSVGNFSHMAPEVIFQKPNTKESDIFSLGLIMWQLYSFIDIGRYKGIDPIFTTEQKLTLLPNSTPSKMKDLIVICLNENPTARPIIDSVLNTIIEIESIEIAATEANAH